MNELVLSAPALRAGGALVRIMGDPKELKRYEANTLATKDQRAIGDLVAFLPELNTEPIVGGLVWLVSFHGESVSWIEELLEEFSVGEVSLVVEYLYEVGVRTRTDNELSRDYVVGLLEFLRVYADAETMQDVTSIESLDGLIKKVGGISAATDIDSVEHLLQALDERKE